MGFGGGGAGVIGVVVALAALLPPMFEATTVKV